METKPLLIGILSFIAGGLLVSIAATTFEKDRLVANESKSMSAMVHALNNKTGDEYDRAFIEGMIAHHEGAVEMAKMSAAQAKHDEIKRLSSDIIAAQEKEIADLKKWQHEWGYGSAVDAHETH
jgi:uncharacterized protein (DUF305 family)